MDKRKAQLQTTQMFSQGKREKKEKERNKRENKPVKTGGLNP